MAKFYLKYSPAKAGITGVEYIAPFLYEHFNNEVSFTSVLSDGIIHYGILEGTGDKLSKAFLALDSKFSILKLSENEFIGACFLCYEVHPNPLGEPGLQFDEFMFQLGYSVDDAKILECVKSYKKVLFKEVSKKKFPSDNDSIADLSKCITLFLHHYNNLTPEQKAAVDANTASLKSIYGVEVCMAAYERMITNLQSILSEYYSATQQVDGATTIEQVNDINYPSS